MREAPVFSSPQACRRPIWSVRKEKSDYPFPHGLASALTEDALRDPYLLGIARSCDFQSPQTVLKTAGLASASVRQGTPKFDRLSRESKIVRARPQISVGLAVNAAVSEPSKAQRKQSGPEGHLAR